MQFIKKIFGLAAIVSLVLFACKKSDTPFNSELAENEIAGTFSGPRACATEEVLKRQLQEDPTLQQRMDEIEAASRKGIQNPQMYKLTNNIMTIPVVVNVLYRTTAENINKAQIQSQIDVLNADFQAKNIEYNDNTFYISNTNVKSGDTRIRFTLDSIRTKYTNKTRWMTNDDMKKSSKGGIDPYSPTTKLNIWVCNLGNSLLGYAQFPGGSSSTDGVVIHTLAFGNGTSYTLFNNYNLGRTATHEVGHWFNLRHIWGDASCGNDQVDDTPQHSGANYGCPASDLKSTCTGKPLVMWMNYMDYTYDRCMYMFTQKQAERMQKTWEVQNGGRTSFIN